MRLACVLDLWLCMLACKTSHSYMRIEPAGISKMNSSTWLSCMPNARLHVFDQMQLSNRAYTMCFPTWMHQDEFLNCTKMNSSFTKILHKVIATWPQLWCPVQDPSSLPASLVVVQFSRMCHPRWPAIRKYVDDITQPCSMIAEFWWLLLHDLTWCKMLAGWVMLVW